MEINVFEMYYPNVSTISLYHSIILFAFEAKEERSLDD